MIKLVFSIGFLLLSYFAVAQLPMNQQEEVNRRVRQSLPYSGEYTHLRSLAEPWLLDDSVAMDRCRLEVEYAATICLDTVSSLRSNDLVRVQVGDSVQKFYSQIRWLKNRNATLQAQNRPQEPYAYNQYQDAVDYEIYRYPRTRLLLNRHALYGIKNQLFEYEEPMPHFDWCFSADTMTVAEYLCQKAETDYAGRHWTVWFTTEIPVDGGLWKFNGLPGLILAASDAQEYFRFTAVRIAQPDKSIIHYRNRSKRMSRAEYRKLERRTSQHPFTPSGSFIMIKTPESAKPAILPLDWEIPYNPIERK